MDSGLRPSAGPGMRSGQSFSSLLVECSIAMSRSVDRSSRSAQQKVGLLRVLRAAAAVVRYCARNAGRLLGLVWFPCLLVAVSQIVLDWLALAYPPRLPGWLLSQHFNPPTWLTAAAMTPWGAMAWAFVLADMIDRNSSRGVMATRILRRLRPRFEISAAVLLAAVIFTAVNLLDGGLRALQLQFLLALHERFEPSEGVLNALGRAGEVVQVLVMAAVVAAAYLTIGRVLRIGIRGIVGARRLTRHNRARLYALFLLLSVAAIALNALTTPAVGWLVRGFADELFWTFKGAAIRQLVDVPFFILWTVVYAVTVGIVLGALEQRQPAGEPRAPPPPRDAAHPFDTIDARKRRRPN